MSDRADRRSTPHSDLWRPTEVLAAFRQVGFDPSLSKVAALWGGTPVTVRLEDLGLVCAAGGLHPRGPVRG